MTRSVRSVIDHPGLLTLLESERPWSAYGLCDLTEPYRSRSSYLGLVEESRVGAALLVFRVPGFTSLIGFGTSNGLEALLQSNAALPANGVFQLREEDVPLLAAQARIGSMDRMFRMAAETAQVTEESSAGVEIRRLRPEDEPAMRTLYAGTHEIEYNPHIVFEGIAAGGFVDGKLVACSGTHAYTVEHGVACIGGVYTHPDYRGRGLAGATTSAVVRELREMGIGSVALNVKQENGAAIRAYRRIGFEVAMPFLEGRFEVH